MRAYRLLSAAEFLERAGPLLEADEARHNLLLGIAGTLRDRPDVYPEFGLWVAEAAGSPVAAGLITPPHNLVLADATDPRALPALAGAVLEAGLPVPGAIGNRPTVDRFNEIWGSLAGVSPQLQMAQGVFALAAVRSLPAPSGAPRAAGPGDVPWLLEWLEAFSAEALPVEPFNRERTQRGLERVCDPGVADAGVWLWEDRGEAVSLAAFGSPTPNGMRVGPVYTPPGWRRRGYGTGVVWAVSAWLLAHGRRRCFLYTDLANPTSNAMYRRIGYEQVGESAQYGYAAGG